jgi:hypothetical protein
LADQVEGAGVANIASGAASTSQRTLTVIIKFDSDSKVRDFSYRTSSLARVRLNLVEYSERVRTWYPGQWVIQKEVGVRDPKAYQRLFEEIGQAIFVKKNL